jgi:hypothetical protein
MVGELGAIKGEDLGIALLGPVGVNMALRQAVGEPFFTFWVTERSTLESTDLSAPL